MKTFLDFESNGPISKSMAIVFGIAGNAEKAASATEADVVITDSVDKLLKHLQQTNHKVVQFCHSQHHPMSHLIEDYPNRLRVVDVRKSKDLLAPLIKAISELADK